MWGDDGKVRLVDFGVALQGGGSRMQTRAGTPYFMPPEIIQLQSYGK
jgi:serine/threonine protein kinase